MELWKYVSELIVERETARVGDFKLILRISTGSHDRARRLRVAMRGGRVKGGTWRAQGAVLPGYMERLGFPEDVRRAVERVQSLRPGRGRRPRKAQAYERERALEALRTLFT